MTDIVISGRKLPNSREPGRTLGHAARAKAIRHVTAGYIRFVGASAFQFRLALTWKIQAQHDSERSAIQAGLRSVLERSAVESPLFDLD